MTYSLPQKWTAEFVGTFTLVFAGIGAICANHMAGGGSGLLGVAFAHGLAIAVMIAAVGHVSGGHFNPAVTAGLWVTKKIDTVDALSYWVAQLAGATSAAFLITLILPEDTWRAVHLGTPELTRGFTNISGMALEAVMTFFLMFVIFGVAVDDRNSGKAAGFAIGLTITMGILFGGPFTGAALNPARALGPALAGNFWASHGVYWVGPLAGAITAAVLYNTLFLKKP